MFKVTKKANSPNIVWDAAKGKPLCRFTGGVFETDCKTVADRLKALGHAVTGEAEEAKPEKAKGKKAE